MNKRSTTDMADANGLQRAIRPTAFLNIKKMGNTGSLSIHVILTGLQVTFVYLDLYLNF